MKDWHQTAADRARQIEHDDTEVQIARYTEILGSALQARLVRIDPVILAAASASLFAGTLPELNPEMRHAMIDLIGRRAGELEQ
jgi:hypothetical protein